MFGGLGCCYSRVRVYRCRGCCSLSVCVCVGPVDLLTSNEALVFCGCAVESRGVAAVAGDLRSKGGRVYVRNGRVYVIKVPCKY